MRSITECFENSRPIAELINEDRIDEGLKDILNFIKNKFKQAFAYLKGIVAKFGTYFIVVSDSGEPLPAISPLTAGQAYKENLIDKTNTFVKLDKEGEKIVGLRTNLKDATKLYGSGNSIEYWTRMIKECDELNKETPINEVKLHTEDPEAKYNIIEDNKELLEEIEMHIKNPKLAKLLIWGAPGIGKTAILMAVVEKMQKKFPDYKLIMKTLSNETPDNFTLPKYIEIDGEEKATDVPKTWLPVYKPTGDKEKDAKMDEALGKGLLFIDELSRATPQVLNVVLPLVNEGVFNGYNLGSGWTIICASNRAEDEMSGQSTIGNALANRFMQVYYEPTVHSWRDWADKQNFISPLLLQWLSLPASENMSGGKFYYMDPNEDSNSLSPTTLMCTPRSWTNAMRQLALYSQTGKLEGFTIFDIPRRIIARTLNSYVPTAAVDSFLAFLEVIQSIGNFDEVVADVWSGSKNLKIDKKNLNKVALPLAQLICTAHNESLPTEDEFVNLANWLVAQNSDQLTSYVLDVFKNVFLGDISENSRDSFFVINGKLKKWATDPNAKNMISAYTSAFSGTLKKWGIFKLEDCPDYMPGLRIISKKYGEIFKASLVDGQEALG